MSTLKKIGDSLPTSYNEPDWMINRRLIQYKRDKGKVDHKREWTMFSTVMKKLKESNYESLRKQNSSYKAWRACFVGERSYDAGGPYRESISNITEELQSSWLPLLIPTQNQKKMIINCTEIVGLLILHLILQTIWKCTIPWRITWNGI